jgi:hypothetical protein
MRCHAGFAPRQRLAHAAHEPAASGQSPPLKIIQGVPTRRPAFASTD